MAALVSGLLVALVLAEGVTRLGQGFPLLPLVPPAVAPAPRIPVVPSQTRVYQLPAAQWPVANAAGLRDYEYPVAKPPGAFRIVVLGDSVAYGYRVDPGKALHRGARVDLVADGIGTLSTRIGLRG